MFQAIYFDTLVGVIDAENAVQMSSDPGAAGAEAAMIKGEQHFQSAGTFLLSSTLLDHRIGASSNERFVAVGAFSSSQP